MTTPSNVLEPLHRLCWRESELVCRCFAHAFGFPEKEVLQFGMASLLKDNPEMADRYLLTPAEIQTYTVPQLRQELRFRGLTVSGRKAELQARLTAEMERIHALTLEPL